MTASSLRSDLLKRGSMTKGGSMTIHWIKFIGAVSTSPALLSSRPVGKKVSLEGRRDTLSSDPAFARAFLGLE
jgi:hypothetical protein